MRDLIVLTEIILKSTDKDLQAMAEGDLDNSQYCPSSVCLSFITSRHPSQTYRSMYTL